MAILGAVVVFTYEKPEVPSTSFTQANTAVLAIVKEGDLILCTDPATNQVRYALLVESSVSRESTVLIHGYFMDKYSLPRTNGGIPSSYFDQCRVEAFRDDRLGSVDRKIGKIVRLGLNPPLPSQ